MADAKQAPQLRLYHYWRSTASWRVRWAFAIKGIQCEMIPVDLLKGESDSPEHRARNPLGYVPVLERAEAATPPPHGAAVASPFLAESVAILEWAEEIYPSPALLPRDPWLRAHARQLAQIINSGTQPLQNLGVAQRHSADPAEQKAWNQHWILGGLEAYEELVRPLAGKFSLGDQVTYPDLFLIPQCYSATRNEVSLDQFPTCQRIYKAARATEACRAAEPERFQPIT